MSREVFATTPEGETVELVTLSRAGTTVRVMTWGASLQDFRLDGVAHALVLGGPSFAPYREGMRNFGATVGRAANRIAAGRAPLAGQIVELERNEAGRTTLHGGSEGCGYVNWRIAELHAAAVTLHLTLPDGQGGFPGNLALVATYSVDDDGALTLEITGASDAPTLCNIAHHSYWNLDGTPDLRHHTLAIEADDYLPVDAEKIPLGPTAPVAGTGFDFTTPRPVLAPEGTPGLDHNFCLRDPGPSMHHACTLAAGGLHLRIDTTEPGLQVYDGATLASRAPGHGGQPYGAHAGLALEAQRWPDAPNQPGYPSITLLPGETYRQVSRFHVTRS